MRRHPNGYLVKLVRDRVREAMGGDGTVTYRPMPRDEHMKRLRSKLLEEAVEYASDPSMSELAQVYETVRCLAHVAHGASMTDVVMLAADQREERGGFEDGVGMYAMHPWDYEAKP